MNLHPERTANVDEWWWCRGEALRDISQSLNTSFVAIVDNFLSAAEMHSLRSEVSAAYLSGKLSEHGKIGGGTSGSDLAEALLDESIRGDLFGFFEGKSASDDAALKTGWGEGKALSRTLDKMNTLVCELRDGKDPSTGSHSTYIPELQSVSTRSRAMVTCYPGNQRAYTKHCDNALGNGRKLTTILYLNPNWGDQDGGELVIYPSHKSSELCECIYGVNAGAGAGAGAGAVGVSISSGGNDGGMGSGKRGKAAVSIAPVLNRLVLFWSDMRCPHEVLPTNRERFALTLWFIDAAERARSAEQRRLAALATASATAAAVNTNVCNNETTASTPHSFTAGSDGDGGVSCSTTISEVPSPSADPAPEITTVLTSTQQPSWMQSSGSGGEGDNTSGACFGVWNAEQQAILYQIKFTDHSQVATTVVDIVEHTTLLVHCIQHSYDNINTVLVLPVGYKVDAGGTTAKYSKKKGILTVTVKCAYNTF